MNKFKQYMDIINEMMYTKSFSIEDDLLSYEVNNGVNNEKIANFYFKIHDFYDEDTNEYSYGLYLYFKNIKNIKKKGDLQVGESFEKIEEYKQIVIEKDFLNRLVTVFNRNVLTSQLQDIKDDVLDDLKKNLIQLLNKTDFSNQIQKIKEEISKKTSELQNEDE